MKEYTSKELENLIRNRFCPTAWAFIPQVRNGTGFVRDKMTECKHKYLIKVDPAYIPDYSKPGTTIQPCPVLVPVEQFRCICCGTTFGYIPFGSILLKYLPVEM